MPMNDTVAEVALAILFGALCVGALSPGAALVGVAIAIAVYVLFNDDDGAPGGVA